MTKRLMPLILRRRVLLATMAIGAGRSAAAQAPAQQDAWPSLAGQIFDGRTIRDGSAILAIDAPSRAEDAALVPVTVRRLLPATESHRLGGLTLVIDENPSPLAAIFTPGEASGLTQLSARVRVDSYTNIHAVAELSDGQLYAAQRFVKAAGGCSAPAARQESDSIPLGTMRFRQFPPGPGAERHEAQLMIHHPNNSGMQMDQLTRLYVPAHFVKTVRIWQGQDLLLSIESGISISENPSFRFDFRPNGATMFRAEMQDSEGKSFHQEWAATAS